jgi:signal transduction histidine kinase
MNTAEGPSLENARGGLRGGDLAQIVHDFKDPLAAITLELCILDRKIANGDPSNLRSITARIIRNVDFLDRMAQNLMDSCSTGDAHLELHHEPTELRALLEQVIDRVVQTRDLGRVALEAPSQVELPIDELRIQRVIANLIANALKYSPPRSRILVRLEPGVHVARISVTDAGPGLSPEEQAFVFDPYRRGTAARGLGGHGLGLCVSKQIVEAHGGRIGVECVPGAGSRFYFELPTSPPRQDPGSG